MTQRLAHRVGDCCRRLLTIAALLTVTGAKALGAVDVAIYTEEAPPISYEQNGVAAGLIVDVVQEIQKRLGTTAVIHVVPWARAYRLALQEPNIAILHAVRIKAREPLFQWVGPLHAFPANFYARADHVLQAGSLDDLKKIGSIGVTRDSYLDQELTRLGFANLDRAISHELMIKKLIGGRTDVVASDSAFVTFDCLKNLNEPRQSITSIYTTTLASAYIAFSKKTPTDTVKAWQRALDDMKADGSFAKLYLDRLPQE